MKVQNKILIVDDEPIILFYLQDLLVSSGDFVVEIAESGEQAIEILPSFKPDLILLDIQLPGMDGLNATKIIRNDPDLSRIPVVALTSYAMQGDEEKAKSVGCTGYIAKPIDTRSFLDEVADYLRQN